MAGLAGAPRGFHVGLHASVSMGASAALFAAGLLAAPIAPEVHQALAGLAGGFSFPLALSLSIATSLAGGYPRRGLDAALAAAALYLAPLTPLVALVNTEAAAALAAFSLASYAAYAYLQAGESARRGRGPGRLRWVSPLPPLSGAAAALWAIREGEGVAVLAAALGALYTLPQILYLSPLTVASGLYGPGARRATLALAATPAVWAALALEGPHAALAAAGAQAALYSAILAAAGSLRALAEGGMKGYAASLHLAVAPSAALLAASPLLGLGLLESLHLLYMGVLLPHPLIHASVRGGVLPFTERMRRPTRAVGVLLASAALARPWEPTASWILAVAGLALAAALLASPRPVPPGFRHHHVKQG